MDSPPLSLMKRYGARVVLPAALVLACIVAIAALGLHSAGRDVDNLSSRGQVYEAYRAIGRSIDDISLAQESVATSRHCTDVVSALRPDPAWLDENVGQRLHEIDKIDETYILDGRNRPVYAFVGSRRAAPGAVAGLMPVLRPFIARTRGQSHDRSNYNERLPNSPLPRFSTVRTTPDTVHATDIAMIAGQPAIVSVMRVAAHDRPSAVAPDRTPLIVSIRHMDSRYLSEIGQQNFLMAARIATHADLRDGERSAALASSRGEPLGFFLWKPPLPGSMLVSTLLPWCLAAIAFLTILLIALAGRIWLLMRRDHDRVAQLLAAHVELKTSEAQAHHLAYHDVLTGLPNRARFNSSVDLALVRARHDRRVALLLLDLDRFKPVNDRFGHLAGDQLIEEVGRRLSDIVGDSDCIARLGGDEFAIMLTDVRHFEAVETVLQNILRELRRPFDVLGNKAHIGVSIGVSMSPDCGTDRSDLMRKADIALYRAKEEGRDCYRFFTAVMDDTVQLRAALEEDLRHAVATGHGLSVHYQPQMDSTGTTVVGLEALLRWHHPTRGTITPEVFVPIAEETGVISTLGDWVIQEACKVAATWPDLSIAVNLSPVQFRIDGFADQVERLVRDAGVEPRQIELEVTEGVLLDDDETVQDSLRGLRRKGFRIALDDFGTGYSSLGYLRKFEVDKIKIDRSFVKHLGKRQDAAAIVTAVVTLGHAMGLRVTAEGVETGDQSAFLTAAGCNELQGFLYSRAVPVTEISGILAARAQAARPALGRAGSRGKAAA